MKMTEYQRKYREDRPEKVVEWRLLSYARYLIRHGVTDPMSYIREREAAMSAARLTVRKTDE